MWKYSFSSPSPLCYVVPLFKRPIENNKHSNFEWRDMGGVWILLFSEVILFEYNVSTILWPIVAIIAWGKRQNHFFIPIFMSLFAIYINILFSRFSRPTTIVTALLHMRWDHVFTRASWKSNLTRGLGTSPWGLSSMDREQVRKAILKNNSKQRRFSYGTERFTFDWYKLQLNQTTIQPFFWLAFKTWSL